MASLLVLSSSSASRNGQTYRLTQQISEEEGDDEKDEKIARSRVFAHTTELAFAPAPVDTTMPAIITAMCTEAPARLLELLDTFLFNELDGVQERVETVMSPYSMTSDVNFVLDRLTPKLSLFAGGSGQSFKFAPLIGDSLARLASGDQPAADISCWSHQREAVRA